MTSDDQPTTSVTAAARRSGRRRAVLVGAVAAFALAGGAGVAYAAAERPVETGYATVVEDPSAATAETTQNGRGGRDCPDSGTDRATEQNQNPTTPTVNQTPGDF